MLKNRVNRIVSIPNRLMLLMFLLGAMALAALFISARVADEMKGSANLINQLGLLRMKSYQLLSMLPLKQDQSSQLNIFAAIQSHKEHETLLKHYQLLSEFKQLEQTWQQHLVPQLKQANNVEQLKYDIHQYVVNIDALVYQIDQKTESALDTISTLPLIFMMIILLFLVIQAYYLRQHLLQPWKQLTGMAEAISVHDFSQRFKFSQKNDEFDMLGQAFNHMSDNIESQYRTLELRVTEKTAELQYKNDILMFLYQATKLLHSTKSLNERVVTLLQQLEVLIPTCHFQVRLYESNDLDRHYDITHHQTSNMIDCAHQDCSICLSSAHFQQQVEKHHWDLQEQGHHYGILFATHALDAPLNDEQIRLILSLVEQITMAMMIDRQIEQQKQYILIKERSAMARELHDSIAQSLSCLKINISCLQMQSDLTSPESIELLATMRKEINSTYLQLRELITSFRLKMNQTGFYASLQELIKEFDVKLGFGIVLNYNLPLNAINNRYAVNLLQIIREALNNIYKHAKATSVVINLSIQQSKNIMVTIEDNGVGLPVNHKKENHYGLTIMQDRAELLNGNFLIETAPYSGTKISVTFKDKLNNRS